MRLVIVIVLMLPHMAVFPCKKINALDILAECMPSLPHSMTIWVGAKG